jgi:3-deoxy-D-manno-octulosonic-acid transferase
MKFDAARVHERRGLDVPAMLRQLGVARGSPVLVAGSTHSGEESLIADTASRLRQHFPDLFLVLVPRHFERGKEVGRELSARGVKFIYRTEVTVNTAFKPGEIHCLLVNTTGELRLFYEHSTVIFVGKSLAGKGGQNPIEPGALGKPMVFGPHMENFAAIAASFVEGKAAIQVQDAQELEEALRRLLANEEERTELGRNGLQVVKNNTGAVERTADMILESFVGTETYIKGP